MRAGLSGRAVLGLLMVGLVTATTSAADLEVVAELDTPPGNVAVTPSGAVITSQHQFYSPEIAVVRHGEDGAEPFPNRTWATPPGPDGRGMHAVLGLNADQRGIVWMADNGAPAPRLIAWDTRDNSLHRAITLPDHAAPEGSFPNDLAIDVARGMVYFADFGGPEPALIALDLESGQARRVLACHASVVPEDDQPVRVDGEVVTMGTGEDARPARVGVNPITIDPTNTWVYYGPMSGTSVYRVRSADLAAGLSDNELAERVERYGDKPVSDGITVDNDGNVYITELNAGAVGVTRPDGSYERLINDERIQWPDGFAAGPQGYIYLTVNQLHRSAPLNKGDNDAAPPFYIFRFDALGEVVPGR
jgi:sugar lactone lactonase YvrE